MSSSSSSSSSSSNSFCPPHPPPSSATSHLARHPFRIALVSDFFHPRLGGVELHQYSLAQALIARGHTVIVITGTYSSSSPGCPPRQGVRYLTNGLKVYYCPHMSLHQQASPHLLYSFLPLLRSICIRNRIDILHCHQATSMLSHECILHAASLHLPSIYTDHSLFGFSSLSSLHLNKLLSFTLSQCSHSIAVSHCSKENLCLRASLTPSSVSVIPNAVDTTKFLPTPCAPSSRIKILVLSRLVYRKGIDLLLSVIPLCCSTLPDVDFVIGGDGPKRVLLDEMVEAYHLHDRVTFLGPLPHTAVASTLSSCHLFLNVSLTEAFCIAILEAVSCGLYVVATRVGGVPEVLPEDLVGFVEPEVGSVVEGVRKGVERVRKERWGSEVRGERHERVREAYNWHAVAERVERVYEGVMEREVMGLMERLRKCRQVGGWWAGWLWCLSVMLDVMIAGLLEWWMPRENMEEGVDFPREEYETEVEREWKEGKASSEQTG